MNEVVEEPKVIRQQVAVSAQHSLELGTKVALVLAALGITGREQRVLITADAAGTLAAQQWSGMVDAKNQPINKPVKFVSDIEILFRYAGEMPDDPEPPLAKARARLKESVPAGPLLAAR